MTDHLIPKGCAELSEAAARTNAMRIRFNSGVLVAAIASWAALIGGCATTGSGVPARATLHQTPVPNARAQTPQPAAPAARTSNDASPAPMARPAPLRTAHVGAELIAGMFVPYDNMSLPIVSPDGRFVATQTRIGPDWATILAEYEATVPYATHIEIYEIPSHVPSDGYPEPMFVAEVDEPGILGRSYDEHGFLIEAPQEDGSRWIGYVTWETGEVTWLVADEYVNAFASLGPDGRLAWSRREVDAESDTMFDLVVRSRNGDEWVVETSARRRESLLLPTWSWQEDGLFVLSLIDGHLEAVHANASDPSAFRRSRQRIPLATEASVFSAYQTIGAQACGPGSTGTINPMRSAHRASFIFFHPSQMRMAIWRVGGGGGLGGVSFLDRLSYAAVMHDADHVLVSTESALILRPVQNERLRSEVIHGMNVPRPIPASGEWPYILVAPEDGRVAIIPMRPLQQRDLANR